MLRPAMKCLLAFVLTAGAGQALAVSPQAPLPTPAGLSDAVHFWEKIFGKYTPDQCVFHDKDDLRMVYAVKTINGDNPFQQAKNVKRYLGLIRASLQHLAGGGDARNAFERRVVELTPDNFRYPAYYRYAMDNVRCQRGVDLVPSLTRAKRHLAMVKKVLAQNGLPVDLAYLPHLESGYDVNARSRAGARGLWQLMPATARLLGLRLTRFNDPRVNPYRATVAASSMLKDFYSKTRSWPLAITAFNYGINGMTRAIKIFGPDYMKIREHHHTGIFGFAAKNYYPSFLAVRNVALAGERASEPVAMETTTRPGKTASF